MGAVKPSSVVRQSERTASRVVDGSAVVIVIDEQKLHTLDEVGTFVWSAAGIDGRSVDSIVDQLIEEFDVDRQRATHDVLRFVEQLVSLGALEVR